MPVGVTRHLLLNSLLQQHLLQKKIGKTWACFKKLSIFYTIFHIQVSDKCSALSSSHAVICHKFKLYGENSDEIVFTILQPVVQCLNPFGEIWPLGMHYLCFCFCFLGGGALCAGVWPLPFPPHLSLSYPLLPDTHSFPVIYSRIFCLLPLLLYLSKFNEQAENMY